MHILKWIINNYDELSHYLTRWSKSCSNIYQNIWFLFSLSVPEFGGRRIYLPLFAGEVSSHRSESRGTQLPYFLQTVCRGPRGSTQTAQAGITRPIPCKICQHLFIVCSTLPPSPTKLIFLDSWGCAQCMVLVSHSFTTFIIGQTFTVKVLIGLKFLSVIGKKIPIINYGFYFTFNSCVIIIK